MMPLAVRLKTTLCYFGIHKLQQHYALWWWRSKCVWCGKDFSKLNWVKGKEKRSWLK